MTAFYSGEKQAIVVLAKLYQVMCATKTIFSLHRQIHQPNGVAAGANLQGTIGLQVNVRLCWRAAMPASFQLWQVSMLTGNDGLHYISAYQVHAALYCNADFSDVLLTRKFDCYCLLLFVDDCNPARQYVR